MAEPTTVQVHPLAALEEAQALNEFYRNRVLLLSNDRHHKTARIAELEAEKTPPAAKGK